MSAIVVDVETTGFSPHTDRITEVAMIRISDRVVLFHELINPGIPIPAEITDLTGISDDRVRDCPLFGAHSFEIARILVEAEAIIGHNVFFDRRMLAAELSRSGQHVKWPPVVCTKRVWDIYEPKESRRLGNAYKRFVNKDGFENAHSALADAMATLHVIVGQMDEFEIDKKWEDIDPESNKWWGGTDHIIWNDDAETPYILVNFGKHKGWAVGAVDKGYWKWVTGQDFPEHVKTLADFIINISDDDDRIAEWAKGHE